MSQPIRGQDGHLDFPIDPKNTHLEEDVEILLPVNFRWIAFNGSGEKSKMSQPLRGQGGHLFFNWPEKHKLGRGRWDLASCQVSLNSVQKFQMRSRKCEKLMPTDNACAHKSAKQSQKVKGINYRFYDLVWFSSSFLSLPECPPSPVVARYISPVFSPAPAPVFPGRRAWRCRPSGGTHSPSQVLPSPQQASLSLHLADPSVVIPIIKQT